jgi:hypothetical protein
MSQSLHEVARAFRVHPANLLVHLNELGAPFDSVWPEIADAWVETVRARHPDRFPRLSHGTAVSSPLKVSPAPVPLSPGVSADGAVLIEKLWRARKWGGEYVSPEQLQKHTRLQGNELQEAIRELVDRGLLLTHGRTGPYSLNPDRRPEIDRLANESIRGHRNLTGG